eukprot:scpid85513/ scgid0402/ Agrin
MATLYYVAAISVVALSILCVPSGFAFQAGSGHTWVRVKKNLCREPCRPFQQCVADNGGGGQPRCGCETQCADSTNTNRQVCASNGKTYSSKCEMRKASCILQRKLRPVSKDRCQRRTDPCSTAQCPRSQVCIPDPADVSRPKCICNHQCSSRINYVCGTNHRSYTSPCHLHKRACEEQTNVTVLHDGLCSLQPNPSGNDVPSTEESSIDGPAGIDPCELVVNTCPANKRCVVDEAGEATCVCKTSCSNTEGARVCGSDGETYFNECMMRLQACHHDRDITIANMGACRSELCKSLNC